MTNPAHRAESIRFLISVIIFLTFANKNFILLQAISPSLLNKNGSLSL